MGASELTPRWRSEYVDYHQISRGRAGETAALVLRLEEHAGTEIEHITGPQLQSWASSRALVVSPATIRRDLGMLRTYFTWMRRAGIIELTHELELRDVRPPRGANERMVPNPYDRKKVQQLWMDFEKQYPMPPKSLYFIERWQRGTSPWVRIKPIAWRLQLRAMIGLALFGGLRREEIFRMKIDNVDYLNEYVVVEGARKNSTATYQERLVPWVTEEMREYVREWLQFRDNVLKPPHDSTWMTLWFAADPFHPLTFEAFELKLTKLGRGWKWHRLRHTAATSMLSAGYPLERVSKILGHSSITQTLGYAALMHDDTLRIARQSRAAVSELTAPRTQEVA